MNDPAAPVPPPGLPGVLIGRGQFVALLLGHCPALGCWNPRQQFPERPAHPVADLGVTFWLRVVD